MHFEILDDCKENNKHLFCYIQKEKLLETLADNTNNYMVLYINNNNKIGMFELIKEIGINYYDIKKEDLFVSVTKLLEEDYAFLPSVTYETNVTNISNVLMGYGSFYMEFKNSGEAGCCFRKYDDSPLLLICIIESYEGEVYLSEYENETILNDINIKYNFRIQPVENKQVIHFVDDEEFFPVIYYPKILDFTFQNTLTFTSAGGIDYYPGIRLNAKADDIECEVLGTDGLLRCHISANHFKGKKSGNYYIIHVNDLNEKSTFYECPPFKVILNDSETDYNVITVENIYMHNSIIGKQGVLALETNFIDEDDIFDKFDIENKTQFTAVVPTENSQYEVNCRLVKFTEEPILVFCELNEKIPKGTYEIYFNEKEFSYNNHTIIVNSKKSFVFEKLNVDIPNLYADVQNITVEDNKDFIELKFKIISYHNEKIFIFLDDSHRENDGYIINILDNCSEENKELTCLFKTDILLEIMTSSSNSFYIIYIDNNYDFNMFNLVNHIDMNYYNIEKEDVYVRITKLLLNSAPEFSYFAYETNVTDISNVLMGRNIFYLDFENEYENEDNNGLCTFRKSENNPLLLVCYINSYNYNYMHLKEIKTEISLSEVNIKYNFKIQPYNNTDIIEFYENSQYVDIIFYYPQVLDFTSQDELIITYIGDFHNSDQEIQKIRLNNNSDDLNCQLINKTDILECVVPKSHFKEKKSGNYYAIHINDLNNQTILYQIPPVKIILNDESEEEEEEEEEQIEPEEEEQVEPEEEEQVEPEEEEEEHGKEEESGEEDEEENPPKGGGKSSNTTTVLIVVFSVVGGILLLVAIFFLIRFLRKKNVTKEDIEQGTSNRELLESQELKESQ